MVLATTHRDNMSAQDVSLFLDTQLHRFFFLLRRIDGSLLCLRKNYVIILFVQDGMF